MELCDYEIWLNGNIFTSPLGMMKIFIVKIDDLAVPIDFIVINGRKDDEELLILRRPFIVIS